MRDRGRGHHIAILVPLLVLSSSAVGLALSTRGVGDAPAKKNTPAKGPTSTTTTVMPYKAVAAAVTLTALDHPDHKPLSTSPSLGSTGTPMLRTTATSNTAADRKRTKPAHHKASRKGGSDDGGGGNSHAAGTAGTGIAVPPASGSPSEGELSAIAAIDTTNPPFKSPASQKFVKQGLYPFVATVQKVCGGCHIRHYCGAVILAPQWVLTLPPCAEVHPGEGLLVRAGDAYIWPGDHSATQRVLEVVWHEAASSSEDYPKYDAILMRLENPFQFSENLNAINLAPPSHNIDGQLMVLGWSPPGQAQQVELNVTRTTVKPNEDCLRIAPQESLPGDTICMQPVEPFLEHCAYDLGDPVIIDTDPPQLVGLLARWYHPCTPERPAVAIKIASVYAWIYEKVNPPAVTYRPSHGPSAATGEPATATTAMTPAPTSPAPTLGPATQSQTSAAPAVTAAFTMAPTAPAPAPGTTPVAPGPHHTSPAIDAMSTTTSPLPPHPGAVVGHVKPMTVSSSSASGALSNTTSSSDAALLAGHMESSLSYSLGTAAVEPGKPALSNSVSVGWANCREIGGAMGMSYALAYSFIGEGTASSASTVNATCLEMNAVQSQGWSISTSGNSAPVNVRAFILEHLASIPGLPRQPTLKYL